MTIRIIGCEPEDPLAEGRYLGALKQSVRSRRGQQLLRDLIIGLDALPDPELIAGRLADHETGCTCALGAVALRRGQVAGKDLNELLVQLDEQEDDGDPRLMAEMFDISATLATEVIWQNEGCDTGNNDQTTRRLRWQHVRNWAQNHLLPAKGVTP